MHQWIISNVAIDINIASALLAFAIILNGSVVAMRIVTDTVGLTTLVNGALALACLYILVTCHVWKIEPYPDVVFDPVRR